MQPTPWRRTLAGLGRFEHAFIAVLGLLYFGAGIATVPHYGVMWDVGEYFVGDRNYYFFSTLDVGYLDHAQAKPMPVYERPGQLNLYASAMSVRGALPIDNPHHTWPFGPLTTSLAKVVLSGWLGLANTFDGHHAAICIWGLLLLVATYYLVLARCGLWPAMTAAAALACHPRLWAHVHFNPKDVPSAAVFVLVIGSFCLGVRREKWWVLLVSAGLWGVALATKANAFFLPLILGPWFGYVAYERYWRSRRWPPRAVVLALVGYPLAGVLVMLLLWPFLLVDFPAHLHDYVQFLLSRGYGGVPHWNSEPILKAVATMPLAMLALLLAGLAAIARETLAKRRLAPFHLLLLLWLVIPVLRVSAPYAIDFDGIRHWLEFLPAAAMIAGLGGGMLLADLARFAQERPALAERFPMVSRHRHVAVSLGLLLAMAPVLRWSIRNHPHQIVYFNRLVGGLGGAQQRRLGEATDYWGISYRTGLGWLNENARPRPLLIVGVAEHVFMYTRYSWLRRDVRVVFAGNHEARELVQKVQAHAGEVYLIYVTRPNFYSRFVRELDATLESAYQIDVDGGTILKILRLKGSDGRLARPRAGQP